MRSKDLFVRATARPGLSLRHGPDRASGVRRCCSDLRPRVCDRPSELRPSQRCSWTTHLEQGHHDEARAEFAAALLIDPLKAEAHVGRAQVHLRSGDYESADRAARRALALNPPQASARYALGASLVRIGRVEEGARELDEFRRVQAEGLAKANQEWELKLIRQSAPDRGERGR